MCIVFDVGGVVEDSNMDGIMFRWYTLLYSGIGQDMQYRFVTFRCGR